MDLLLSLFNHTSSEGFTSWIRSIVLFVAVSSIGFILRKYVAKTIRNIFSKIGFVLNNEIIVISKNYISFWFFLVALYVAFLIAPINNTNTIAHRLFYGLFAFSMVILFASILSKLLSKSVTEKIGINIIKLVIILIGLALILNQLGVELTPVLAALGLSSLPVALSLQDTFANFFAGVSMIAGKQIVRGDYVKIDLTGLEGTIIEINWRTTLIKDISNSIISIPNNKLLSSIVTSFHLDKSSGVNALIKCGVAYGSDLEHVERIAILATQEIVNKYDDSVKTFIPIVQFTDFADFSINFTLIFKVESVYKKNFMQSEVLKNLYKKFNDEGIKIPYPHRVITLDSK
ncbi:MAG: mechanosensitive ion channel [Endomicrobium sp.]|jgi:small-conductance mechanosensitive channel|nr:mechanosensitive ion channel [Endomicrobium sp.]